MKKEVTATASHVLIAHPRQSSQQLIEFVRTEDILQKSMTPLYQNDRAIYVTSHCNLGVSLDEILLKIVGDKRHQMK